MHLYVLVKENGHWSNGSSEVMVRRLCDLIEFKDKLVYLDGKPAFIDSNYDLSVSHSDKLMVIAIAQQAIGIDLEKNKDLKPELIDRLKLSDSNPLTDWCLREAVIKLYNDKTYLYKEVPENTDHRIIDVFDGYTCVIASPQKIPDIKIIHLNENAL